MRFGRIGAALVVVGSVSGILAWAMGFTGTDVRWGEACWQWAGCGNVAGGGLSVAQWIAPIALTLLGIGSALLSLAEPDPLVGRVTRIAVATLAVGLVSLCGRQPPASSRRVKHAREPAGHRMVGRGPVGHDPRPPADRVVAPAGPGPCTRGGLDASGRAAAPSPWSDPLQRVRRGPRRSVRACSGGTRCRQPLLQWHRGWRARVQGRYAACTGRP